VLIASKPHVVEYIFDVLGGAAMRVTNSCGDTPMETLQYNFPGVPHHHLHGTFPETLQWQRIVNGYWMSRTSSECRFVPRSGWRSK